VALQSRSLSLEDDETVSSMTIDSSHQRSPPPLYLLCSTHCLLSSFLPSPSSRVDRKTSFLDFSSKKNTDGDLLPPTLPLFPHFILSPLSLLQAIHYRCSSNEITVTSSPQHPERYEFALRLISKLSHDDEVHFPLPLPTDSWP
jgi:hypothetical protein